ncbi:hypothetical protein QA601_09765 [Chitinispirillales bacterium ANBcel5]|uniref:hypothetical protein n=1 Tax=Cellulosispirillum alkaliphilum TaxID=3039283 RepID=UPI002A557EB9|nr:hypothetical protein [Chitinispirillales bacterium ANBcel5]
MFNDNSKITSNHRFIKKWVEERGGFPVLVPDELIAKEESGVIRILFPEDSDKEKYEPISWDKFFEKFDQAHLAFLCEKNSDGHDHYYKLISINGE